jgi:hypothetical protein
VLKASRDRFSSNAATETHDVKFLRQVRTSLTASDDLALRRMLARRAVVYQTLVSAPNKTGAGMTRRQQRRAQLAASIRFSGSGSSQQ